MCCNNKFFRACMLLLALAYMATAQAQTPSASASLSAIGYQLFDLAPADGIVPALTINARASGGFTSVYRGLERDWLDRRETLSGAGAATIANAYGRGAIDIGEASLQVSASTSYTAVDALAGLDLDFTLTPYTRVLFTAMSSTALAPGAAGSSGESETTLVGRMDSIPGQPVYFESYVFRHQPGSATFELSGAAQTAALAGAGHLALTAFAVVSGVAPVPELPAWAMLLAGLILVAALRWAGRGASPRPIGKALAAFLGVAALAASAGAHAQTAAASSSISAFGFTLSDLAPDDGIAPELTLTRRESSGVATAYRSVWRIDPIAEESVSGFGSAAIQNASGQALLDITEDALAASVSTGNAAFAVFSTTTYDFVLTPYTRVLFGAATSSMVDIDPATGYAESSSGIRGDIHEADGPVRYFQTFYNRFLPGSADIGLATSVASGALPAAGSVELFDFASASAAPIPEPASWAMLGAGLGWLALRRRKRASCAA